MIKKHILTSMQASLSQATEISKTTNSKTDDLISRITDGIQKWESKSLIDDERDREAARRTEEAINNQTAILNMLAEGMKANPDSNRNHSSTDTNETKDVKINDLTKTISKVQHRLTNLENENLLLKESLDNINEKYQSIIKNIAALRTGQVTTSMQLSRTQDLSKALNDIQPKTYAEAINPKNDWKTVQRSNREIKPQPTDDKDQLLMTTTLGDFNSAKAVCVRRKHFTPPTDLSASTILATNQAITERKKAKEEDPTTRHRKAEELEDNDTIRDHMITETFQKNKLIIGLRPITLSSVEALIKNMENKGIFDDTHDRQYRQSKAMQTTMHMFLQNQLKMSEEDRRRLKVTSIFFSTNCAPSTLYVECETFEDTANIYKHTANLPKHAVGSPQLDYFTPPQFYQRRSEIETMAWQIRKRSGGLVQTNIRQARSDYVLRSRPKGSNTPWADIPPIVIPDSIAKFEISKTKPRNCTPSDNPSITNDNIPKTIFSDLIDEIRREKTEEGQSSRKKRRVHTIRSKKTIKPTNTFELLQTLTPDNETSDDEDDEDDTTHVTDDEVEDEATDEVEPMETKNESPISSTD